MNQNIKVRIKGKVSVSRVYPNGKKELLKEFDNALTADAPYLIWASAIGNNNFSAISAYKDSNTTLLATAPLDSRTAPNTGTPRVILVATFDEASFNDTLDSIRLIMGNSSIFSQVTGLSITKDNLTKLEFTWTISFSSFNQI